VRIFGIWISGLLASAIFGGVLASFVSHRYGDLTRQQARLAGRWPSLAFGFGWLSAEANPSAIVRSHLGSICGPICGPIGQIGLKFLIYQNPLAETEGFEPSIELYNPITV
jgi:hypothetical protein